MIAKDCFSAQAAEYSKFRFGYPDQFIQALAALPARHATAWDAGCGSGQATISIARYFDRVLATDISAKQIDNAVKDAKIDYQVRGAESSGLADASVDLITAAQAVHWFDLEAFYREAKRVLRADGAIAVWCYTLPNSRNEIDSIVKHFYADVLGKYWDPCLKVVDDEYKTLPFPFHAVEFGKFTVTTEWSYSDLIGHLSSWSAARSFQEQNGYDPFAKFHEQLLDAWGNPDERMSFIWPLHIKAGKVQ
jgi:SAM-dependent methyltransferase